jgi:HK97 family phage major capsid protein
MSAASKAFSTPSGEVGSIGVYSAHQDISGAQKKLGVKTTLVSAGKFKTERSPFEPLSDEAKAAMQEKVDAYYEMFVAAVAEGRGVSVETVRDTFGQGRTVMAAKAADAGMVDAVATYEDVLAELLELAAGESDEEPDPDEDTTPEQAPDDSEPEPSEATTPAASYLLARAHSKKEDAFMAHLTEEQLQARQDEIRSLLEALNTQYDGQEMPDEARSDWNALNEEVEANETAIGEFAARRTRLAELAKRSESREDGAHFHTNKPGVARGEEIYDLSTVEMRYDDPKHHLTELRDRAMRSVEAASFPRSTVTDDDSIRGHIAGLLDTIDGPSENPDNPKVAGELARRILATGSPAYQRAFSKTLLGKPLDSDEARAMSVGTGSGGGFAVVYTLDPTIIPTSNYAVNPWRAISNVEQIAGTNEWRGVTSGAVTASRVAEGTEATDNSPTLAQPALIVTKVHTFIPFSVEIGQDWPQLQAAMARLIQDAKDVEESAAFATGDGNTPNPQGVITGASTTVAAGGTAAFAVADVYKLWEALPPRFRPNAKYVANLFTYDKIRQFDTAGGASLFIQNLQLGQANGNQAGTLPAGSAFGTLLGKPAYESSDMAAALTTGSKIGIVGDFSYYKIVDRIGMDIEIIPQLFGATSRYPTGQRGIYAYWRNYAKVLNAAAFRVLVTG